MIDDSDHFNNLPLPLYPNDDEVAIYKKYKGDGKILLLGYTKQLIHLCDCAMDLNPPETQKNIIKQDWFTITEHYDTIIGDGVVNLAGGELIEFLSHHCDTLIIRFFTQKINGMKYATHFESNTNFLLPNIIIETQPLCKILIWNFKQ